MSLAPAPPSTHQAPQPAPWRPSRDGLLLRVRVSPKASRDGVDGLEATAEGPALKVRVRALPEDGAANEAVIRFVAAWLGLSKGAVSLAGGPRSRIKTLALAGDPARLTVRLEALLNTVDGKEPDGHA